MDQCWHARLFSAMQVACGVNCCQQLASVYVDQSSRPMTNSLPAGVLRGLLILLQVLVGSASMYTGCGMNRAGEQVV